MKKQKTLLELANEDKPQRRTKTLKKEEYDLALSWANGEITTSQMVNAILSERKTNVSTAYHSAYKIIANAFKIYLMLGELSDEAKSKYAQNSPSVVNESKVETTYSLGRKCEYCSYPISDQSSPTKKYCKASCRKSDFKLRHESTPKSAFKKMFLRIWKK